VNGHAVKSVDAAKKAMAPYLGKETTIALKRSDEQVDTLIIHPAKDLNDGWKDSKSS
jgi:hypothetical protein